MYYRLDFKDFPFQYKNKNFQEQVQVLPCCLVVLTVANNSTKMITKMKCKYFETKLAISKTRSGPTTVPVYFKKKTGPGL